MLHFRSRYGAADVLDPSAGSRDGDPSGRRGGCGWRARDVGRRVVRARRLGEIIGAFATEPVFATDRAGRLLLEASDGPAWLVTFGGERNLVASGDFAGTDADAVARGTSDQLYRWAWNRPASVATTGDPQVLASWRAVRVE